MRAVVRFRKRQSLRQTRQTARRSERDRLIEWQRVRMSSELIWNSTVLVIIRESRQPLLNYRSHQHDWLRLGNCNTNLIIYRLYYYSDHFLGKVGVLPVPPHVWQKSCVSYWLFKIFTKTNLSHTQPAFKLLIDTFFFYSPSEWFDFKWRSQYFEGGVLLQIILFFWSAFLTL